MNVLTIQYFAELAQVTGCAQEKWSTQATDLRGVYAELCQRYGFRFSEKQIKPVRNNAFVAWNQPIADGDELAFLPPFSGG